MDRTTAPAGGDSIKETVESIVIAFILAFTFRAFIVEAFRIPTGSMAPTLLGEHLPAHCPKCGYGFDLDLASPATGPGARRPAAHCPMCQFPISLPGRTYLSAGDRILVHKYIYSLPGSQPRRWDVVVFKAPHAPETNYIKRLVGLPSEDLLIVEGNIYTKPSDAGDEAWRIARKGTRPEVQRAVWQSLYRSDYVPLDHASPDPLRGNQPWKTPWEPVRGFTAEDVEGRRSYPLRDSGGGELRFNFSRLLDGPRYAYNQVSGNYAGPGSQFEREPIEDVRVVAGIEPGRAGLGVALSTTARWEGAAGGGPHGAGGMARLTGRIDGGGRATLEVSSATPTPPGVQPRVLASAAVPPLAAGRTWQVELWQVDQEVSLWLDGRQVLRSGFEVAHQDLRGRAALQQGFAPDVRVQIEGGPAVLHGVGLDRDIYYSSSGPGGAAGLGGVVKSPGGGVREMKMARVGPDEFFCMGDNSPLSSDGRYWLGANPWVRHWMFDDQHDAAVRGLVPRKLLLGRAFFVYWPGSSVPAPFPRSLIPNFGAMRFIH